MTITPLILAQLCSKIYSPVAPGSFDTVLTNGSVTVGIKKIGDVTALAFAGSEDFTDWRHDLAAAPFNHPTLKTIHFGFWQGVENMFAQLKPYLTGLIAMCGHSLGCAHAAYTAALCRSSAIPVQSLYMYAPPRMSYTPLAAYLHEWVIDIKAWRNTYDPIPGVPMTLSFAPWVPIAAYIPIDSPPANRANLIAWHGIDRYCAALAKMDVVGSK